MKRLVIIAMVVATVLSGTSVVQAQDNPPLEGVYKTTNGDFLEGRSATAWPGAVDDRLTAGNTLNMESFDGTDLATEWSACGMQIVNVQLIADLVFGGNGQRIYLITYAGGVVTLDGGGIWGGGDPVYIGIVDAYVENRTVQIAGGIVTGANSNHSINAHLQDYASGCIVFGIGNGVLIGDTDPTSFVTGVKPGDYPGYVDATTSCGPITPAGGRWGNVSDLTLTVTGCAVPIEERSWGAVKSLYQD